MDKINKDYILPISILVAAILVCGTIFYNTNLLITKLGGTNQNQQAAALQNQNNNFKGISERSSAPVLGNQKAKVAIVEFSDFQCPFCQKFTNETFNQIKTNYIDTGKAKIIFRNFPLVQLHVNAEKAAEAAECANQQGKFWQYQELLFKNGKSDGAGLAANDLKNYAGQAGLNQNQFNSCLDTGATAQIIQQDIKDGQSAGVTGTPSFFVNGKLIVGALPYDNFKQAIEEALK